ncbi:hypothetical protein HPT25_00610 [Bacillus sp. BRMEA1]|uniref:hypothetical protein n=1 Tax=Neobacillus endophyticus TaxID=2738405 RepID=UPI0015655F60|nr:hypothetical protein [Neobacillus endophyticus]NRD76008.1 hypothetical protein [Neobacillus endophyticus]
MENFLWAFGSLVILIPIVYFLPLGISTRGKWLIMFLSFLLGILGLSAQSFLPLWELAILILILVGLVSFILDRRMGGILSSSFATEEEEELPIVQEDPIVADEMESTVPIFMEELMPLKNEEDRTDAAPEEILISTDAVFNALGTSSDESNAVDEPTEMEILEDWGEQHSLKSEVDIEPLADLPITDDFEMVESNGNYLAELEEMLSNTDPNTDENESAALLHADIEETDTLSLVDTEGALEHTLIENDLGSILEELLVTDPLEPVGEQEDIDKVSEVSVETVETDELRLHDLGLLEDELNHLYSDLMPSYIETAAATEIVKVEELEEDSNSNKNIPAEQEHEIELEQVLPVLEDVIGAENEGFAHDHVTSVENELFNQHDISEIEYEQLKQEPVLANENNVSVQSFDFTNEASNQTSERKIESNLPDELENTETKEQMMSISHSGAIILQRQLLHTMVSQLKIVKKTMDPLEYEALVQNHMNAKLSAHDYFTFASMLIEHYIHTKDYMKLEALINNMMVKIAGYPILEKQVEFIYRHYCQNNQ